MEAIRLKSGLLASACLSTVLAGATLSPAPTANATCFSIFGIGNGNGCTSNLTSYALAIGEGAVADANLGFFGGAFAMGANARAVTNWTGFTLANALGNDAASTASLSLFSYLGQFGTGSITVIGGPNLAVGVSNGYGSQQTNVIGGFNILAHMGPGTAAALGGTNVLLGYSGGNTPHAVGASGLGNIAVQLGPGSSQVVGGLSLALGASPWGSGAQRTLAGLFGTVAINLIGDGSSVAQGVFGRAVNLMSSSSVEMAGILSTALNVLGNGNTVRVLPQALLSVAFGILSDDVTVTAGPGPLSFAGALFQNGVTVGQAIGSAINSGVAPINGAAHVASQALTNAMSAASAGDAVAALAALASVPRTVVNTLLYGYDPDGAGPEDPLPGLLSPKSENRDGGPIYQFFVALPEIVSTAVANVSAAAEASAATSQSVSAASAESNEIPPDETTVDDTASAVDDGVDEGVSAGVAEQSAGADEALVDDNAASEVELDEISFPADLSDDAANRESPEPTLAQGSGADSGTDSADRSESGSNASGSGSDEDSGASSGEKRRPGKHRAGPRHAA